MPALLRLPLTIASFTARQTLALAKWGVDHVTGVGEESGRPASTAQPSADSAPEAAVRSGTATVVPQAPVPPAPPRGEIHVDSEPVEVASVGPASEPSATIEVAAPWDDYDSLPASEVIARVRDGDAAVKAAVALYEARHKGRSTVLAAASSGA